MNMVQFKYTQCKFATGKQLQNKYKKGIPNYMSQVYGNFLIKLNLNDRHIRR